MEFYSILVISALQERLKNAKSGPKPSGSRKTKKPRVRKSRDRRDRTEYFKRYDVNRNRKNYFAWYNQKRSTYTAPYDLNNIRKPEKHELCHMTKEHAAQTLLAQFHSQSPDILPDYDEIDLNDDNFLENQCMLCAPSDDDREEMLRRCREKVGNEQTVCVCGICGVYDREEVMHMVNHAQLLPQFQFTPEENEAFENSSAFIQDSLHSVLIDNKRYRFAAGGIDGYDVRTCDACETKLEYVKNHPDPLLPYPKRSLAFADWGRIPEYLPKLTELDKLAISKYVTHTRIEPLRLFYGVGQLKIQGHGICIPLSDPELRATNKTASDLPRRNISEHYSLFFIGSKEKWNIAKNLQINYGDLKVNVENICAWLRFLKEVHPLYKNVRIPGKAERYELEEVYAKEVQSIIDNAVIDEDKLTQKLIDMNSSDVARQCPNLGQPDSAVKHHGALPSKNILLISSTGDDVLEQRIIKQLFDKIEKSKKPAAEDEPFLEKKCLSYLPNEFANNPQIISGAFPYLFPRGLNKDIIESSATVPERVVKRWLTFYDTRFATAHKLLFFLFSQKMRHGAALATHLKLKGGKFAKQFSDLINEPNFDSELKFCVNHPGSKRAKALYRRLTAHGSSNWSQPSMEPARKKRLPFKIVRSLATFWEPWCVAYLCPGCDG